MPKHKAKHTKKLRVHQVFLGPSPANLPVPLFSNNDDNNDWQLKNLLKNSNDNLQLLLYLIDTEKLKKLQNIIHNSNKKHNRNDVPMPASPVGFSGPMHQPAMPMHQPAMPMHQPAMPMHQPAMPMHQPAMPIHKAKKKNHKKEKNYYHNDNVNVIVESDNLTDTLHAPLPTTMPVPVRVQVKQPKKSKKNIMPFTN
jgi:hypothetical protein